MPLLLVQVTVHPSRQPRPADASLRYGKPRRSTCTSKGVIVSPMCGGARWALQWHDYHKRDGPKVRAQDS